MENATKPEGSHPFKNDRDKWIYGSGPDSLEPGYAELDAAATLTRESKEVPHEGVKPRSTEHGREETPLPHATAGFRDITEELFRSATPDENFEFYRRAMESNRPVRGVRAAPKAYHPMPYSDTGWDT